MSQIGDLVRTLRTQPQRVNVKDATAMLDRARAEGVAPEELRELQTLLRDLKDNFSPELRESLTAFVDGGGAQTRPVQELVPELGHLATLDEVIERFSADLTLLRAQLVDLKGLPGSEKAQRLFEFLLAYAGQFIKVTQGEVKPPPNAPSEVVEGGLFGKVKLPSQLPKLPAPLPVPRSERDEKIQAFAHALKDSGFSDLRDGRTGKDAVAIASQLLTSKDLRELQSRASAVRLEAPAGWTKEEPAPSPRAVTMSGVRSVPREVQDALAAAKERPRAELDRIGASKMEAMRVQPWQAEAGRQVIVQPVTREDRPSLEDAQRRMRTTDKVLGRNMLWNWLHTYREGDDGQVHEELATDRLAFGTIFVFIAVAVVAIALVAVG